ncbi:hypothetical protein SK128_007548 [Halocaridina rubra]|uniref:Uncharacterized protein n=1 Tax=Halocaridina rubra TaxID=373956 RepID=A0AAN9FUX1_HALRR
MTLVLFLKCVTPSESRTDLNGPGVYDLLTSQPFMDFLDDPLGDGRSGIKIILYFENLASPNESQPSFTRSDGTKMVTL